MRHGLIEANSLSGDEANYSELENLDYESGINQEPRMTPLSLKTTSASQNTIPANNDKIGNNSVPHCQQSTTNVRQYYRWPNKDSRFRGSQVFKSCCDNS